MLRPPSAAADLLEETQSVPLDCLGVRTHPTAHQDQPISPKTTAHQPPALPPSPTSTSCAASFTHLLDLLEETQRVPLATLPARLSRGTNASYRGYASSSTVSGDERIRSWLVILPRAGAGAGQVMWTLGLLGLLGLMLLPAQKASSPSLDLRAYAAGPSCSILFTPQTHNPQPHQEKAFGLKITSS
ncbi:hypothetical protein C8R42DRAFT_729270 [Lentinula raphanica]|nr:hypothetical protein C8R42DRAFT_729270 [Lentinula raphanica]